MSSSSHYLYNLSLSTQIERSSYSIWLWIDRVALYNSIISVDIFGEGITVIDDLIVFP